MSEENVEKIKAMLQPFGDVEVAGIDWGSEAIRKNLEHDYSPDVELTTLESAIGAESRDPNARRAWATALAIGWLRARAADLSGEWQLIADKGMAWLASAAPRASGSDDWMEHATRWHEAMPAS